MNAFDAVAAGAGETGLASLLASTTIAAPQATSPGAPGATPFAQLLDQLNTLPVPQAGTVQTPLPVAEELSPTLSTLPLQQSPRIISPFLREVPQVDRAPVSQARLECGLRLPATGKIMPPAAPGGTILPAPSIGEMPPRETTDTVATLPTVDHLSDPAGQIPAGAVPLVAAQLVAKAPPLAAAGPAIPVRSAGASRAEPSVPAEVATPAVAAPIAPTAPAAPAVTLVAADVPALAAGEGPAASERGTKAPTFAEALPRPMVQVAADLGGTSVGEIPAAMPQVQAEPQQPAMQDLTRIVERLAAAREAAAPAATQLAVDHAEFGPLSLSIRQSDGGELTIAVAAADRDSQVALVAAISQGEAPGFEQAPDRRGGESGPREQMAPGQHGESRGQGGQRDRLAGQQQQQRQTMPQRGPAPERDGETRSGTYA